MGTHKGIVKPVVRSAVFSMAHVPGMVLSGSKPRREVALDGDGLQQQIVSNLRSFADAVAYPPHQVMIGQSVDHLLGCGEEAVGDRYQRGGGNLAKAMGEMVPGEFCGGTDVKSFCAGAIHAMILGAHLIASGMHRRVVVVGGHRCQKG